MQLIPQMLIKLTPTLQNHLLCCWEIYILGRVFAILGQRCIGVQVLGGDFHGQRKLTPRILLSTAEGELPFVLTRKQCPIKLCFAMTVDKLQG